MFALFPILLVLALTACSTSAPPVATAVPTSLFSSPLPPPASALPTVKPAITSTAASTVPAPAASGFRVAAIVDTTTQQVTREQAQALINEASGYLREFSPIGLAMTDYVAEPGGGFPNDMLQRYFGAHTSLPDGFIVFSQGENGRAKAQGAYGYYIRALPGFKNRFLSPEGTDNVFYIVVVDRAYRYMPCGYDSGDAVTSTVSFPGECRGQTGIACVQNNGYSMCSNAVGNLYTSTPTHPVASLIVHALLHNFGPNGDKDDYATPECNARMGYPASFFDLQESEYYNGICPFVYDEFSRAFRP